MSTKLYIELRKAIRSGEVRAELAGEFSGHGPKRDKDTERQSLEQKVQIAMAMEERLQSELQESRYREDSLRTHNRRLRKLLVLCIRRSDGLTKSLEQAELQIRGVLEAMDMFNKNTKGLKNIDLSIYKKGS
jgi:hypothetical protein